MSAEPNDIARSNAEGHRLMAGAAFAIAAALCAAGLGVFLKRPSSSAAERLAEIAAVVAFASVLAPSAVGIAKILNRKSAGALLDDLAVCWGLGICVLINIIFGMCAVGILSRTALAVVAVAFALIGGLGLGRLSWRAESAKESLPASGGVALWLVLVAAPLAAWLLAGQFRGPDVDEIAYHFAVPAIYLEHGGFCPIPFNVYSNMPLGGEMLITLCMGIGGAALARLFMSLFAIGIAAFIIAIARRWFDDTRAGVIGAALFFTNQCCAYGPYVDFALTFWCLMSLYAYIRWRDDDEGRWLIISGIAAGMCMATKYTGFFSAATVGALLLWRLAVVSLRPFGGGRAGLASTLRAALLWGAPAALLASPWLIKNYYLTGNPVYPMLFGLFGGPDWSGNLHDNLIGWHRLIGMGRSLGDYLLLPWNVAMHFDRVGYRYFAGFASPAHLIFVPPAVLMMWKNERFRLLAAAAALGWFFWSLGSQQVRFLLPALSVTMILGGLGASGIIRLGRGRRVEILLKAGVAAVAAALMLAVWWRFIWLSPAMAAELLRPGFRIESKATLTAPQSEAILTANRMLPPFTARFLLIDFNGGWPLAHQYVFDSFYEAPQTREMAADCASAQALHGLLMAKGFTHAMRRVGERRGLERFFASAAARERFESGQRILDEYLTCFCTLKDRKGDYEIYEIIRDRPAAPPPEAMSRWMPRWTGAPPGRW